MRFRIFDENHAIIDDYRGRTFAWGLMIPGIICIIISFLFTLSPIIWGSVLAAGICSLIAGLFLFFDLKLLDIDKTKGTLTQVLIVLGIRVKKKTWNINDVKEAKAKRIFYRTEYDDDVDRWVGEIYLDFKNGEEKRILTDHSGKEPINCVKYFNLFFKGEHTTPGTFTD